MATYPGAIPSLVRPAAANRANDGSSTDATVVVGRISDEVEAIAGELGINPRGASATVKARLDAIEANGWVTSARILDGTIATGDLADGAITPIKLAGGYTAKTATYTATQDDRVIHVTSGTATINLPAAASSAGRVYTIADLGTGTVTIDPSGAELIGSAATLVLAGYGQATIVSTGSAWIILDAFYWNESVGRRLFRWNHAASSGAGAWQFAYGDTGWRDIGGSVTWDATQTTGSGTLLVRRTTQVVAVRATWTSGASALNGRRNVIAAGGIPSGFRPTTNHEWFTCLSDPSHAVSTVTVGGTMIRNDGGFQGCFAAAQISKLHEMSATYTTLDAWPSSLPGSAFGSIPA